MKRAILVLGVTALSVMTLFSDVVRAIVFGWIQFLARVIPQLTWDRNAVLVAVGAFLFFTLGVHWLGRTWRRDEWKSSWSLVASVIVIVAFAAGICMIGVVHQTGWLMSSEEPLRMEHEQTAYGNAKSEWNLKTLAFGIDNAISAHRQSPGFDTQTGIVLHSWATYALAYSDFTLGNEQGERVKLDRPWDDVENQKFFRGVIPTLVNPELKEAPLHDSKGFGLAHYAANSRAMANGVFRPWDQFTDGKANTLLIGEVNAIFRPWGDPGNVRDPARGINRSPYGFAGAPDLHGGRFAMADGSVRFFSERTSPDVMRALATPDGGEPVEAGTLLDR